jgi:hypothetical protein
MLALAPRQRFDVQSNCPGDAADGEIAGNIVSVLTSRNHFGGLERDGRITIDVQKVTAFEMAIALGFASADRGGIHTCLDPGGRQIRWIEFDQSGDMAELALDVRNHHVPDLEVRSGMLGVDLIGRHS